MKIYYEEIILLNFLLDYMILYGTKRILKRKVSNKRIVLGSIFGSLTTIFLWVDLTTFELLLIKIILSMGMIRISFGKEFFLENIFYFYMISILLGGFLYLIDIKTNFYLHLLILISSCIGIIKLLKQELFRVREKYKNEYDVKIIYQKKEYLLQGFIDTGNHLKSPIKKEPVILVNLKLKSDSFIYVPYKALNTTGIIPCIRPDKIIINKKEINNYLIGIVKDKIDIHGFHCILPNQIKEEL